LAATVAPFRAWRVSQPDVAGGPDWTAIDPAIRAAQSNGIWRTRVGAPASRVRWSFADAKLRCRCVDQIPRCFLSPLPLRGSDSEMFLKPARMRARCAGAFDGAKLRCRRVGRV